MCYADAVHTAVEGEGTAGSRGSQGGHTTGGADAGMPPEANTSEHLWLIVISLPLSCQSVQCLPKLLWPCLCGNLTHSGVTPHGQVTIMQQKPVSW